MRRYLLLAAVLAAFSCPAAAQQQASGGVATGTGYPAGSAPFSISATGTTSATLTLNPTISRTIFICNINSAEVGATSQGATGSITNMLGPAATSTTIVISYAGSFSGQANVSFVETFTPCLVGMFGQAIVITTPTATGASATSLTVSGYAF